jgi:hypothetical protein
MKPTIYITRQAYNRVRAIVQASDLEVSMLGEVEVEDKNIIITEIHIPKQTRSPAFTEIVHDGISELLESGVDPSKIKCWIHSHVNMGVSPSGQDVAQAKELMKDSDWFMRGIFNKKNEYTLSVHWNNFVVDCDLLILEDDDEDIEAIKKEIQEKTVVRAITSGWTKPPKTYYPGHTQEAEEELFDDFYGNYKKKLTFEEFKDNFGIEVSAKEIYSKWIEYQATYKP